MVIAPLVLCQYQDFFQVRLSTFSYQMRLSTLLLPLSMQVWKSRHEINLSHDVNSVAVLYPIAPALWRLEPFYRLYLACG